LPSSASAGSGVVGEARASAAWRARVSSWARRQLDHLEALATDHEDQAFFVAEQEMQQASVLADGAAPGLRWRRPSGGERGQTWIVAPQIGIDAVELGARCFDHRRETCRVALAFALRRQLLLAGQQRHAAQHFAPLLPERRRRARLALLLPGFGQEIEQAASAPLLEPRQRFEQELLLALLAEFFDRGERKTLEGKAPRRQECGPERRVFDRRALPFEQADGAAESSERAVAVAQRTFCPAETGRSECGRRVVAFWLEVVEGLRKGLTRLVRFAETQLTLGLAQADLFDFAPRILLFGLGDRRGEKLEGRAFPQRGEVLGQQTGRTGFAALFQLVADFERLPVVVAGGCEMAAKVLDIAEIRQGGAFAAAVPLATAQREGLLEVGGGAFEVAERKIGVALIVEGAAEGCLVAGFTAARDHIFVDTQRFVRLAHLPIEHGEVVLQLELRGCFRCRTVDLEGLLVEIEGLAGFALLRKHAADIRKQHRFTGAISLLAI